jgi:hypothetical protein
LSRGRKKNRIGNRGQKKKSGNSSTMHGKKRNKITSSSGR